MKTNELKLLKFWKYIIAAVVGFFICFLLYTIPSLLEHEAKSKVVSSEVNMTSISLACSNFHSYMGYWPKVLVELNSNSLGMKFIENVSKFEDGWGREFIYTPVGDQSENGLLLSLGADGKVGGEGYGRDIEVPILQDPVK